MMRPHNEHDPLRIAIIATEPLRAAHRVFLERLAAWPQVKLCMMVVDTRPREGSTWWRWCASGIREGGLGWLGFQISKVFRTTGLRVARWLFERFHPPRVTRDPDYEDVAQCLGLECLRIADVSEDRFAGILRAQQLHLTVVLDDHASPSWVAALAEYGALCLRREGWPTRKGALSRMNSSAEEPRLVIGVEHLLPQGTRRRLATDAIDIEECDTLGSLRIKADLRGFERYLATILQLAREPSLFDPAPLMPSPSAPPMSEYEWYRSEKELATKVRRRMPTMHRRGVLERLRRLRVFVQYVTLLPYLCRQRRQLVREGRAPIWIVFYHVVANRPLNHMAIPLERFAAEVELIRRYHAIIPLGEGIQRLRSPRNDEIGVVLTFDDGYQANQWALEYLQFYGIPASFFVAAGHVQDETPFQHDVDHGWLQARPWSSHELREVARTMALVSIESHGVYHEDFGKLTEQQARDCLEQSKALLSDITGTAPTYFSFPYGLKDVNVCEASYGVACELFEAVFSAYGGYNLPGNTERQHFLRFPNPADSLELLCYLTGYTSFGSVLRGDAWSMRSHGAFPFTGDVERHDQPCKERQLSQLTVGT